VNAVDIGMKEIHLVLDVTRPAGMQVNQGRERTNIFSTPPFKVLKKAQDKRIKLVRSETLINGANFKH